MAIYEHVTTFAGLPVVAFDPGTVGSTQAGSTQTAPALADPSGVAWRVDTDYDGGASLFQQRFDALLATSWAGQIRALVIGEWGESYESDAPIELLVAAASTLTNLTALFLGEMTGEENEISWIQQGDITALLDAYPGLEVLRVRGSDGLTLSPRRHAALRELALESGGLPGEVVRSVGECDLPALSHLELWLGTDNYGGDATVADLATILAGARLPALTHLGLRDAEIADMVAAALAGAPVVARLTGLDLSLGMLSDIGAAALLAGQPLTHLRRLDLRHHYLSEEMMARLRAELTAAGVEVDLTDAQGSETGEDDRYIAVSE